MGNDPLKEYKYKEKLELKEVALPSEIQKIDCPSCATTIPADNLNIQTNIAKCNSCNGIFSFGKEVEKLSSQNIITQEILRPEGVELTHFQDELDISVAQHWTTQEIMPLIFFPYLAFFLTVGLSILLNNIFSSTLGGLAGVVISLLTIFFGYFSYFSIRKKHKIYIHIDDRDLHIEWRPKKFIKDKKYAIRDIDQVYIRKAGPKGAGIFMIINDIDGQKHVELIKSVNSRTKAKYIEQEIEKYLGIEDRRVPDEEN